MPEIFERTELAGLKLANRLVRSATWEAMATPNGEVTPRLIQLYRALVDGGVGLIISSYLTVHEQGRQNADQIGAHSDHHIEGLRSLAQAVHSSGGVLVGQIVHCGGQSQRKAMNGLDILAPSAVASPGYPEVPTALSPDQIAEIIDSFAKAAGRLKTAGFAGVQLHGAHGYLLAQFLSPQRNQRTDRYGGSLENRSRFCLEVYRAVRQEVGPDFPVMIKLNSHDFLDGSTTEVDSNYLAQQLAQAGIDAIEVSGGTPGSGKLGAARAGILQTEQEAYFLPQAKALRKLVPEVPLILVGGLRSMDVMQGILDRGEAELFALCRPLIREPDLPARWKAGRRTRAGCISCLHCFGPATRGEGIRCVDQERGG